MHHWTGCFVNPESFDCSCHSRSRRYCRYVARSIHVACALMGTVLTNAMPCRRHVYCKGTDVDVLLLKRTASVLAFERMRGTHPAHFYTHVYTVFVLPASNVPARHIAPWILVWRRCQSMHHEHKSTPSPPPPPGGGGGGEKHI